MGKITRDQVVAMLNYILSYFCLNIFTCNPIPQRLVNHAVVFAEYLTSIVLMYTTFVEIVDMSRAYVNFTNCRKQDQITS